MCRDTDEGGIKGVCVGGINMASDSVSFQGSELKFKGGGYLNFAGVLG